MAARLAEIAAPFGRFEILFIDDCSTDGTLAEVKSLAERDPRKIGRDLVDGYVSAAAAGRDYGIPDVEALRRSAAEEDTA